MDWLVFGRNVLGKDGFYVMANGPEQHDPLVFVRCRLCSHPRAVFKVGIGGIPRAYRGPGEERGNCQTAKKKGNGGRTQKHGTLVGLCKVATPRVPLGNFECPRFQFAASHALRKHMEMLVP